MIPSSKQAQKSLILRLTLVSAACANLFFVNMSFLTFIGALGQVYPNMLTHTNTHVPMKRGHVCLRSVVNILVISLGVTAEHTHPCYDKQRGLSCPLRIRHKHQSDQPHFACGSLHLLVNESNKCANVVKNSLLLQSVLTASPQGLSPVPRGRCKISLNHLIFFFILTVTITHVTEEKSAALPQAL